MATGVEEHSVDSLDLARNLDSQLHKLLSLRLEWKLIEEPSQLSLLLTISFGQYKMKILYSRVEIALCGGELHLEFDNGKAPLKIRDEKCRLLRKKIQEQLSREDMGSWKAALNQSPGMEFGSERKHGRTLTKDLSAQSISIHSFGADERPVWSFKHLQGDGIVIQDNLVGEDIGLIEIDQKPCTMQAHFEVEMWHIALTNFEKLISFIPVKAQKAAVSQLVKAYVKDQLKLCNGTAKL